MAEAIISRATIGEAIDPTKCLFTLSLKTSTNEPVKGMRILMNDAGTESYLISDDDGIIHAQPISGYADCKCSVCGAICNVHVSAGIPTQRYCYRCGAKMLED